MIYDVASYRWYSIELQLSVDLEQSAGSVWFVRGACN